MFWVSCSPWVLLYNVALCLPFTRNELQHSPTRADNNTRTASSIAYSAIIIIIVALTVVFYTQYNVLPRIINTPWFYACVE